MGTQLINDYRNYSLINGISRGCVTKYRRVDTSKHNCYQAIVIKTPPMLKTPPPPICPWARIFKTPPTQIAPQAKNFETPPGELGKFGVFRSPRARSARKILGVFALENSVFNEIWVCLLQNFETPPGQIGEFLRIFETPPTQIGPWARIFETPPDELVAGGDLKASPPIHDYKESLRNRKSRPWVPIW